MLIDEDGNIKNNYSYNAWGYISEKSETIDNPFTYYGQIYDEETGLYYLRARYYDPKSKRFITEDPARDEFNWYAYCGNNPINFVDSLGLKAGDLFDTIDEAAIDFAECYYSITEYTLFEIGTLIYSYNYGKENIKYSYVLPE